MAFACRLASRTLQFSRKFPHFQRNFSNFRNTKNVVKRNVHTFYIIGGGIVAFTCANLLKSNQVQALSFKKMKKEDERLIKLSPRERRFIKFASVEYNGQLYMTPLDFLDSVVEQEPRARLNRRVLTDKDIEKIKDGTPPLKKGSVTMFRELRNKGMISYTEYLFLLSVLTKPQSGFRIAFNMFDTDGNQKVDKKEFLVIQSILGGALKKHKLDDETRAILQSLVSPEEARFLFVTKVEEHPKKEHKKKKRALMENIFSAAWKDKHGEKEIGVTDPPPKEPKEEKAAVQETFIDDEEGLQRRHKVDTTLQVHFFGRKGNEDLNYDGFYKFMDNLQTEVLELEFSEFSKGNQKITEVDFARILLRYTYLETVEYDMFLERLLDRIKVKEQKGITFDEFRDFCRFLNNLEDFAIAMRMYTLADRSISKDEFKRAVTICTGYELTSHLINTVFAIFDEDGDGLLSYKEFIAIMKDRLHRGFKLAPIRGFNSFKQCLRDELMPAN